MKNLAFHSLLRWRMIILPTLNTSLIHFYLKGWENVLHTDITPTCGGIIWPGITWGWPICGGGGGGGIPAGGWAWSTEGGWCIGGMPGGGMPGGGKPGGGIIPGGGIPENGCAIRFQSMSIPQNRRHSDIHATYCVFGLFSSVMSWANYV